MDTYAARLLADLWATGAQADPALRRAAALAVAIDQADDPDDIPTVMAEADRIHTSLLNANR